MKFVPSNADDIRRYYEGTYVKLREFGDKLFQLTKVYGNRDGDYEVVLTDSEDNVFSILLEEDEPYHMEFSLPHKACFAFSNSVYMLQRIPARQYKKGITGENTSITEVFTGQPLNLSFKRLEAFVQKMSYVPLNSALFDKKPAKIVGVPLSSRFSFHCPTQCFYVDHLQFAHFNREKNLIEPTHTGMYSLFASHLKKMVDVQHPKIVSFV